MTLWESDHTGTGASRASPESPVTQAVVAALLLGAASFAILLRANDKPAPGVALLSLLVVADLVRAGRGANPVGPKALFLARPALLATLKAEGAPRWEYHHAIVHDLTPATDYEIQVTRGSITSPIRWFTTAPGADRDVVLLFGGDSRTDRRQRRIMNGLLVRLTAESDVPERSEDSQAAETSGGPRGRVLALVHGGDYVEDGGSFPQWLEWLDDLEAVITEAGRLLPIVPARGNHDGGTLFQDVLGMDRADRNFYAISLGPRLRLVTLNTETTIAGDQSSWLATELPDSRSTHRWLIAQYHRPAYPAVKWPSGALFHWVPLFERFHVDLVCEADGHVIKRTVPIKKGRMDESGVVYVGEGGLGVDQRTPKKMRWYLQPPGMADQGHHVQRLSFLADRLRYECVLEDGSVLDRYERKR